VAGIYIYGNQDKDVSDYLKAFIFGGDALVVGLIGDGTSMEVVSNWNSPFEGDSLASLFEKVEGGIQIATGMTGRTALMSRQIWEGNQPYLFNLVLKFYALKDPMLEVESAIKALEKIMAPDVHRYTPGGRIPETVQINIGRNRLYEECVITNMSVPLDKERDKNGNLIRCEVNLQIETIEMVIAEVKEEGE
jgi:hypothetical protein